MSLLGMKLWIIIFILFRLSTSFLYRKTDSLKKDIVQVTWSDGELDWGMEDYTVEIIPIKKTYVKKPIIPKSVILNASKKMNTITENFVDKETVYNNIDNMIELNIQYFQYLPIIIIPSAMVFLIFDEEKIKINYKNIKKSILFTIVLLLKSPKMCS